MGNGRERSKIFHGEKGEATLSTMQWIEANKDKENDAVLSRDSNPSPTQQREDALRGSLKSQVPYIFA